MKNAFRFVAAMILPLALMAMFLVSSCEGPRGPAGSDGTNGTNGTNGINGINAAETCKQCHNPTGVQKISDEFEFSKHSWGEAAFEEAGNTSCTPCHADLAYKYVVDHNVPATFTLNSAVPPKYVNNYATISSQALGLIGCTTCHSSIHTTYTSADTIFTNTGAVALTMWAGTKSVNLTQDAGMSNLCIKCHQPRPLTTSTSLSNGNWVQYDSLKNFPNDVFYDSTVGNAAPNRVMPSYRTHVHYGVVGAVFAGQGAVEFAGTASYANSAHTTVASCADCHMATVYQRGGGHTFFMRGSDAELGLTSSTTWNFNGCNVSGCHSAAPISASSTTKWTTPRANQKALLDQLAAKINALGNGTPILHANADPVTNLWMGLTTGNWDGYLDIYDASTNPNGYWRSTTSNSGANATKPRFPTLTNRDMGAMINFQFALREYSLGIHNTAYTSALLTNTIALFP